MEKFITCLNDINIGSAYNEITLHSSDYSKLELANIIKEMLFAIGKSEECDNILLDVASELEDIYDLY